MTLKFFHQCAGKLARVGLGRDTQLGHLGFSDHFNLVAAHQGGEVRLEDSELELLGPGEIVARRLLELFDRVFTLVRCALYYRECLLVGEEFVRLTLLSDDLIGHHRDKRAQCLELDRVLGTHRVGDAFLQCFVNHEGIISRRLVSL